MPKSSKGEKGNRKGRRGYTISVCIVCYLSHMSKLLTRKHPPIARHRHSPWFIPGMLEGLTGSSSRKWHESHPRACRESIVCTCHLHAIFSDDPFFFFRWQAPAILDADLCCTTLALVLIECNSKREEADTMATNNLWRDWIIHQGDYERFVHSMDQ